MAIKGNSGNRVIVGLRSQMFSVKSQNIIDPGCCLGIGPASGCETMNLSSTYHQILFTLKNKKIITSSFAHSLFFLLKTIVFL